MAHFLAGLGGGKPMALKKAVVKKKITEYDISTYLKKSDLNAAERMRQLDQFRLHSPLPDECALLNIPDDRVDLGKLADILLICGGNQGVRFSTEDLIATKRQIAANAVAWKEVCEVYDTLSTADRKVALDKIDADATDCADDLRAKLTRFHALCDAFLSGVEVILALIRAKHTDLAEIVKHPEWKVPPDPEKSMGSGKPEWLQTLLDMCSTHLDAVNQRNATAHAAAVKEHQDKEIQAVDMGSGVPVTPAPVARKPLKMTVGVLSAFISGCSTGVFPCDNRQQEALSWLIQASNDTTANVTISQMSHGAVPHLSRAYFAHRFFNFLSAMTELKSTPKDAKSVEMFDVLD